AADVMACVRFAREHDVPVSVRGGGHSIAGKAVCDGGLMIDLSRMKGIRVEPARRIAHAQPGLTLGEFDQESQAFGLATPLGTVSMTGIAGLTLGGGIGWLMGKFGLACDNLLSVGVVTAEGRLLTASATENEDLFWGVRGGAGNFGIVTEFQYRLHPLGPVLAGPVFYPVACAREVLRFYRDLTAAAPDELTAEAGFLTGPDGIPLVAIIVCSCASLEEGERILRPLRAFGSPSTDAIGATSYLQHQKLFDPFFPPGQHHYWKSEFLAELSDAAIEVLRTCAATRPSPQSFVILDNLHGAVTRVGPNETAFPHRRQLFSLLILATWSDPVDSGKNIQWARQCWEAVQPFSAGAAYVNFLSEGEGDERVQAAYGTNHARLVALKNKYDPTNFFRMNQNIRPSV
ncbi:MAG: FAD-binding oxidoreductase, partial [Candidatus Acidiferrales bacterium]